MKILQVMAGGRHGGAETACIDMCVALKEAGEDITLATRPNPRNRRLVNAGIPVYTLPFGGSIDLYTPWQLGRLMRKIKPDIIQTWMGRAAAKIPVNHGNIPVVSRLGNNYKMKNFRHSDYFTTITPAIRDYLIENGVAPDKVRHINNFAETEESVTPVQRSAFDTPDDAPLLLALGRLHDAKAFDTLITAMVDVPDACLWIAGEGPDREKLEAQISRLNLQNRVKLLGWRDDRAALFQAADICVFPSRFEPFGTVFVQAWAQRVPLVTSAADGARQFVRDGEDGLMVPINDSKALATAIRTMIGDKSLQARLVANGYQRYKAEFTKEQAVKAYLDFYRDILNR
ncbi:MAG: glycosyltransferase [Rhodospirillales bacterium]|nr:glycosyltransferase [Rhodospirillales bacterium]